MELASLFGLGGGDEGPTSADAHPDVSTEGGESVVMSFQETQGVLLETQTE